MGNSLQLPLGYMFNITNVSVSTPVVCCSVFGMFKGCVCPIIPLSVLYIADLAGYIILCS